jgi:Ca2+-binding RTX toxin-like protein
VFKGAGGSSGSIHVGSGNATVTGGYHPDRFVFDSTLAGQVTKITNFYHGSVPSGGDKIVLSEKDFSAVGVGAIGHALPGASFHVGASAKTLSQHIVYNHANGFLYYDPSGSAGSQIHFATLTSLPDITHSDFVIEA